MLMTKAASYHRTPEHAKGSEAVCLRPVQSKASPMPTARRERGTMCALRHIGSFVRHRCPWLSWSSAKGSSARKGRARVIQQCQYASGGWAHVGKHIHARQLVQTRDGMQFARRSRGSCSSRSIKGGIVPGILRSRSSSRPSVGVRVRWKSVRLSSERRRPAHTAAAGHRITTTTEA